MSNFLKERYYSSKNEPVLISNLLQQMNYNDNNNKYTNNIDKNDLSFLENKENELDRLINFVKFLSSFNIQINDLNKVQEILILSKNLAKIYNLCNNSYEIKELANYDVNDNNCNNKNLKIENNNVIAENELLRESKINIKLFNVNSNGNMNKNINSFSTQNQEEKFSSEFQSQIKSFSEGSFLIIKPSEEKGKLNIINHKFSIIYLEERIDINESDFNKNLKNSLCKHFDKKHYAKVYII
jgi:hypothetical protein